MSIEALRQTAALGGHVKVDQQTGEFSVKGQTVKGKVVEWFRARLLPGTVAKENAAVMKAFIRAIGTDSRYGMSYANMAAQELSVQLQKHKPLTERRIEVVLNKLDGMQAQNSGMNKLNAERFSSYDICGDPHCFGSIWARTAADLGFPVSPKDMETSYLCEKIKKQVTAAGDNGKSLVPLGQAKDIAQKNIREFLATKKTLLEGIKREASSDAEFAVLKDRLFTRSQPPGITAAGFVNRQRINDTLDGYFSQTLERMATERGLGDMAPHFATSKLKQSIDNSIKAGEHAVSLAEIQATFDAKIAAYLDKKEAVANELEELNLTPESRARMREHIADRQSLTSVTHYRQALVVADRFDQLVDTLLTGPDSELHESLNAFQKDFVEAFEPLKTSTSSAGDFIPLMGNAITLWKEQRSESPVLQSTIDGIMHAIEGPAGQGLVQQLEAQSETDEQALYDYMTITNLFDQIRNGLTDVDLSAKGKES